SGPLRYWGRISSVQSSRAKPPTSCSSRMTRSTRRASSGARSLRGGSHMRINTECKKKNEKFRTATMTGALAVAFAILTAFASAQDNKKTDGKPAEAKKADAKAVEVKKKSPPVAVVGADIYTITKGVIRNGAVLIQDGKITRVGQDVEIPADAVRIDAKGKVVTPGFVTINAANVGIRAGGGGGGGRGGPPGQSANATDRFADSLNPFYRNIAFCLGAGITTACVEVGGGGGGRFGRDTEADDDPDGTRVCPCCGLAILPTEPIGPTPPAERTARRHAVLKMTFGDMAPMLVKE